MTTHTPPRTWRLVLLCGLALSVGWGIRGNFGHEYGAMIPGGLAALGAVIAAGRADWLGRAPHFAALGALGWAFGGSMSYMMVISYTHSGHLPSQVYGFACLAVLGFLWAALGGAGTALAACLDRRRLADLYSVLIAVFLAWTVQDVVLGWLPRPAGDRRHEDVLYWYDTDWLAALTAPAAVLLFALARRRLGWGGRLALTLAGGWWAGFLTMVALVDGLGVEFRMTPPRGDNWAGVTGMTLAALWFFRRTGYPAVAHAMLVAGAWGAVGFAGATAAKLVEVKYVPLALEAWLGEGRWQTNWHSVLEQTYGFINGLGIAAAMRSLARRQLPADEEPVQIRWVDGAAVAFVLLAVPYVNLVKNVPNWVKNSAIPAMMVGLPARAWFDVMFGAIAVATLYLIVRHRRQRLAVVPAEPLGGAQLLFVAFLWTVVVGNWMRAIPPFAPQRLITEGVIHVNAVLCTVLALCAPRPGLPVVAADRAFTNRGLLATAAACLAAVALFVAAATGVTRAVHGDKFAGHGGYHVRFGPDAKSGKPQTGLAHP